MVINTNNLFGSLGSLALDDRRNSWSFLILEVPRPRQLHELHSFTLGSAGDFNISHLPILSTHVAKVGRQRSSPLLRGVLGLQYFPPFIIKLTRG